MTSDKAPLRVAVIGMGPRGLGALEAVARLMPQAARPVTVEVFDTGAHPGAGPNFGPEDSPLCLLNTPLRALDLGAPPGGPDRLASFAEWSGSTDPDSFPARSLLGGYLAARFDALVSSPPEGLRLARRSAQITALDPVPEGWRLRGPEGGFGPYDEVLLTPGQPATDPDPQLARWQEHAERTGADLQPAYPARALLAAAESWAGQTVAIRGLGLSTFDVLRLLTLGLGGSFTADGYVASGREPARILPFSLNGHPPAPKPQTAALDAAFDPTGAESAAFDTALAQALDQAPRAALEGLATALLPPARRILRAMASPDQPEPWLETEQRDPGAQDSGTPLEVLRHGIAMATGAAPPSAGYVIGQIWRKWQNALRQGFNPARCDAATAAAILGFDEGLKRFSYGPPLRSAQELLALVEAGRVDLCAAEDPSITLTERGWSLSTAQGAVPVRAMVDGVLPAPRLDAVTDPLVAGLWQAGQLRTLSEDLGAETAPDGQLAGAPPGLCLLGRMALGSVIAVDSLHDCFGAATDRWAEGLCARHR